LAGNDTDIGPQLRPSSKELASGYHRQKAGDSRQKNGSDSSDGAIVRVQEEPRAFLLNSDRRGLETFYALIGGLFSIIV
jgi:hypothetical protein